MWTVARSITATVNVELGCKVKLDVAPGCGGYRDRVRISELAARVGVPISTVRYYERIGLLGTPTRTLSGYRDYGEDEATRLLFVFRARKMGLSCEQILDLIPIWGGMNCLDARERVDRLIHDKQAEIAERITQLSDLAAQLHAVRVALAESPPPQACQTDLSCCVPEGPTSPVPIELVVAQ